MEDIRDIIFKSIINKKFKAVITAERDGCLSGVEAAKEVALGIDVAMHLFYNEGDLIKKGDKITEVIGTAKQLAIAEEKLIGCLAKYSGIASAANRAVSLADNKVRVVSGSWKKMPGEIKDGIRKAIISGGASFRISTKPMVYLDKNYICMLGSIPNALASVNELTELSKVIQIKGKQCTIEEETKQALENGCNILMVDTGELNDLERCIKVVEAMGRRNEVEIAFAGGVKINEISTISKYGMDVLCIGKEIVDAPLLDMKFDVEIL